ncbi:MAG: formimidoylglutamate deiminase [Deltaproteobacteria bacterium]|nr:formimidoylglutamate deiminase [Deltaproteobacteria bacterium]
MTAANDQRLALPGFVNAHSHAFQRALRGRVERKSVLHAEDDFWSWRTTMYQDAARLGVDDVAALAAWAYSDMLRAGFVAVGEFHYLHHDVGARALPKPLLSLAHAAAAEKVGIKLVLLECAYLRGGFERSLVEAQRRFVFPNAAAFLTHVDAVRAAVPAGTRVGVAVHSVRAVPRAAIVEVAAYARREGLVLHAHACEQPREVEECKKEYGCSPVALLEACGALGPRATLVHATHADADDVRRLAATGAAVCITPSTERNLGDGLGPVAELFAAGVPVCLGSDSHARIDVADELRSLEDHERLRQRRRNVLVPAGGALHQALLPAGTTNGRRALGLDDDAGDRVGVAMPIEGRAEPATALDAWLVGGSSADVRDVDVAGVATVRGGALVRADLAAIEDAAVQVLRRLQRP